MKELTHRQRAFVEAYLSNGFNATRAAETAGYSTPRTTGRKVRNSAPVSAVIEARLSEAALSANEVLARLASQATASIEDFLELDENGRAFLNLAKARDAGKLHLIHSLEWTEHGPKAKLYDAQAALVHLGRHHGLFTDKQQVNVTLQKAAAEVQQLTDDELLALLARETDTGATGAAGGET